jgi:hypothetical protein
MASPGPQMSLNSATQELLVHRNLTSTDPHVFWPTVELSPVGSSASVIVHNAGEEIAGSRGTSFQTSTP